MADVKWIKLNVEMFNDEKIRLIESMPEADTILIIWIKLISMAGKVNSNGQIFLTENIPYTAEMLSTLFRRPLNIINLALSTFQGFSMLNIDEIGVISLPNWDKHQNVDGLDKIREMNKKRQQKFRISKKIKGNNDSNVTHNVTVTQSNAIDIDIEEDKEKDLNSRGAEAAEKSSENNVDLVQDLWIRTVGKNPNYVQREDTELMLKTYGKEKVLKSFREAARASPKNITAYVKAILETNGNGNGTKKSKGATDEGIEAILKKYGK